MIGDKSKQVFSQFSEENKEHLEKAYDLIRLVIANQFKLYNEVDSADFDKFAKFIEQEIVQMNQET